MRCRSKLRLSRLGPADARSDIGFHQRSTMQSFIGQLAKLSFVQPCKATELPHTPPRQHVGDFNCIGISDEEIGVDLVKLSKQKIATGANLIVFIENCSKGTLGHANSLGQLRNVDRLAGKFLQNRLRTPEDLTS